jgi:SAM-dependent methyltransferase
VQVTACRQNQSTPVDVSVAILRAPAAVITFSNPSKRRMDWTVENAQTFGAPVLPRRMIVRVGGQQSLMIRVECFTDRQSFTKSFSITEEFEEKFHVLMQVIWNFGYRQILVQLPDRDFHILRTTHDERYTVKSRPPSRMDWEHVVSDRSRPTVLDPEHDAPLLYALDLTTANGVVLAPMADKFRQLNHLIGMALKSISDYTETGSPVHIIDAGCGKAYLSIALYYVLTNRGVDCTLLGIDSNPHVIEHANNVVRQLGFKSAAFHTCDISDVPDQQPCTLLIALHACDVATDLALHLGIRTKARSILVAPCCHHYVQKQLSRIDSPDFIIPILEDGITKERFGDILTDVMRRDLVRSMGYDAHLIEFISLEHTHKNILLRAEYVGDRHNERYFRRFKTMSEFWGASPYLVKLIDPVQTL